MTGAELLALAEHHEERAIFYAKQARINSPWKHDQTTDAAHSANHFAVAAGLRVSAAITRARAATAPSS